MGLPGRPHFTEKVTIHMRVLSLGSAGRKDLSLKEAHSRSYGRRLQAEGFVAPAPGGSATHVNSYLKRRMMMGVQPLSLGSDPPECMGSVAEKPKRATDNVVSIAARKLLGSVSKKGRTKTALYLSLIRI